MKSLLTKYMLPQYLKLRTEIPESLHICLGVAPFIIFLLIWAILSYGEFINPLFLPNPTKVVEETIVIFKEHNFLSHIGASVFRVIMAFLISAAIAIPLGLMMGGFKVAEAFFTPFTAFVRYMPVAAFIPLLILWLGIGHIEKITLLFIGIFFYLLILITNVALDVRQEYFDTAYTLGATERQVFFRVLVPASLPGIFDSLRAMMGVGWTYIIVVELVAAKSGIGKMIIESQRFLQTPRVIAGIITIGVIGILCDLIFKALFPVLFKWSERAPG